MKKLIKVVFGTIIFCIIFSLKPFVSIRIGKYPIDRIGPYTVTPEIWKRKKQLSKIKSIMPESGRSISFQYRILL